MAAPNDVYNTEVTETARKSEDLVLRGNRIPAGRVVELRSFYVADLTTVNRTLRIGYDRYGTLFWLKRQRAGASEYGIAQNGRLVLVEHERPVGMIESVPDNDTVVLFARGIYL